MGAQGTALLDFGVFPGKSDTSVVVIGQGGITSPGGSLVEAWVLPAATADHSADEHILEPIEVYAGTIVAGVGFTIYGIYRGLGDTLPYGVFNVAWVWN